MGKGINIKCSFFVASRKAFDTLDIRILLNKLENFGVRGNCLSCFNSCLFQRFQFFHANNCSSDWLPLNTGVPQESF